MSANHVRVDFIKEMEKQRDMSCPAKICNSRKAEENRSVNVISRIGNFENEEAILMQENQTVVLVERPRFFIPTAKCFRVEEGPVPVLKSGEIQIRTHWLGMEPYLLGKVKRRGKAPIPLGGAMEGPAVGVVAASEHSEYAPGDRVTGLWSWAKLAVALSPYIRKLPAMLEQESYALGALGYTGFGAWLATGYLGRAGPGDTVVIGAASGGMGQMVGQMAKLRGYRAVGIAGTAEKCALATDRFGFDQCLNRHSRTLSEELRQACPNGIDLYIEVVGGHVFEAAWALLNLNARVVSAGLMAVYSGRESSNGPDRSMMMLNDINLKRLQVRGMVVLDYMTTHYSQFKKEMLAWLAGGQIKPFEYVVEGLENAPSALQCIFEGKNLGKTVVKVTH